MTFCCETIFECGFVFMEMNVSDRMDARSVVTKLKD